MVCDSGTPWTFLLPFFGMCIDIVEIWFGANFVKF